MLNHSRSDGIGYQSSSFFTLNKDCCERYNFLISLKQKPKTRPGDLVLPDLNGNTSKSNPLIFRSNTPQIPGTVIMPFHFKPFPAISRHYSLLKQLQPLIVISNFSSHVKPFLIISSRLTHFPPFPANFRDFQQYPAIPAILILKYVQISKSTQKHLKVPPKYPQSTPKSPQVSPSCQHYFRLPPITFKYHQVHLSTLKYFQLTLYTSKYPQSTPNYPQIPSSSSNYPPSTLITPP